MWWRIHVDFRHIPDLDVEIIYVNIKSTIFRCVRNNCVVLGTCEIFSIIVRHSEDMRDSEIFRHWLSKLRTSPQKQSSYKCLSET